MTDSLFAIKEWPALKRRAKSLGLTLDIDDSCFMVSWPSGDCINNFQEFRDISVWIADYEKALDVVARGKHLPRFSAKK